MWARIDDILGAEDAQSSANGRARNPEALGKRHFA
jgi:hypothetical protein